MTLPPALLVGTGGALGAVLRHAVAGRLNRGATPYGTVAVNAVGSFALGLLAFSGVGGDPSLLVGTGACGSFTTYSSFSVDAVTLWQAGRRRRAVTYAGGTFVAATCGVALAWALV
ncbi:MAG: fluoride efflux transporter CrcB [Halobacteriaceae archaeon]